MTNLSTLRAQLAENNMDVLTPQSANMVKGGSSSYGYGNGSKKNKSKKKNSKGGNNYGGGYGGGYGCGCSCGH
jgi:hypothetical protein